MDFQSVNDDEQPNSSDQELADAWDAGVQGTDFLGALASQEDTQADDTTAWDVGVN